VSRITTIEQHTRKIREHLDEINEALDLGIEKRPITIGLHTSLCSTELLELYLHLENKISIGKQIKHNWFKRPKQDQKKDPLPDRKIGAEFPDKERIYSLLYNIEEERDNLVYGRVEKEQTKKVLKSFQELKSVLIDRIENKGVEIE